MTEEVQETPPVENTPPPADPPAEPEVVAAEPEPTPEAEPAPPPTSKKPPKWVLDRLSEESNKARQAFERAEAAERRAREAEELLKRFNQPPGEHRQDPVPRYSDDQSRQEEIRREAARMRFQEDVNDLNAAGMRAYGAEFDTAVNVLASVTGQGDPLFEFVNQVMGVDRANAHTILHQLGTNPEEAAAIARMNPNQRIAALVRMSMAPTPEPKAAAAPASRKLSQAPAPAPALQPTAHKTIDWRSPDSDKLSDDEWFKAWDNDERRKARAERL